MLMWISKTFNRERVPTLSRKILTIRVEVEHSVTQFSSLPRRFRIWIFGYGIVAIRVGCLNKAKGPSVTVTRIK